MSPATEEQILAAEARLGVRFPDDYRAYMIREDGGAGWYGEIYLALHSIDEVVELNEIHDHQDAIPGLVLIGGDGGGEVSVFAKCQPPVVLVNLVSGGWHEASYQAASFTEFMEQRARGEEFSFEMNYE
jgi:hypothetical protein